MSKRIKIIEMSKMLTVECLAVVNYIIEEIDKFNDGKIYKEQIRLSCGRLVKLLYFCEVEYMKRNDGKPMFEEDYYAWPSGPVIPLIYDTFIQFESDPFRPIYNENSIILLEEVKLIINSVLEVTKNIDTEDLIDISKNCEPYWQFLNPPYYYGIIPKDEIYNFYLNNDSIFSQTKKTSLVKKLVKTKK